MSRPRRTLFSALRDEGPFLLEWVAFHRAIGFDRVLVYSNDCTDGSDRLLDALAAQGAVEHHRQEVPEGEAPQFSAAADAMARGAFEAGEWVLWLDLDEFLNVHLGDGDLGALIGRLGNADGVFLNWRIFGSSGNDTWPGAQVGPDFTRASRRLSASNRQVKTLFRYGDWIEAMDPHRPVLREGFAEAGRYFMTSGGKRAARRFYQRRRAGGRIDNKLPGLPHFDLAQVNHYTVRSRDAFLMKARRGRGYTPTGGPDRFNAKRFARMDRNAAEDRTILRLMPRLAAETARLLADPATAAAQRECLETFRARVAEGV